MRLFEERKIDGEKEFCVHINVISVELTDALELLMYNRGELEFLWRKE